MIEEPKLPEGFEWCRKGKYDVKVELACYALTDGASLPEGFEKKEIDGKVYAVKSGFNVLEQNSWTTSPNKPYVLTGTVGERWPVKTSNLSAYDVNPEDIGIEPLIISTKDPSDQEFMVAVMIPEGTTAKVVPSWAFNESGIDETQIMYANSESSLVPHNGGDYIVAKYIPGLPQYLELPEEIRNRKETSDLYDPRIVNGSVMQTTYDHALTQREIITKNDSYGQK